MGGQPETLSTADVFAEIGFPDGFVDREPDSDSAAVQAVIADHDEVRKRAKYATPLLLATVAAVERTFADAGIDSSEAGLAAFRVTEYAPGRPADQLVMRSGPQAQQFTTRSFYDRVARIVTVDLRRLGLPIAPGHATSRWTRFEGSIEAILKMAPEERLGLALALWDVLLALPQQRGGSGRAAVERPFTKLLVEFEHTQPGERSGALLQALAYAYYRADAPNVDLETGKVRDGGSRTRRIGDVDGYSGDELALTVEVKDKKIDTESATDFGDWLLRLPDYPNALAVALAQSFDDPAIAWLAERGVATLDRPTMLANVKLWDLQKQQTAMRAFWFYLNRIEREPNMMERFDAWCADNDIVLHLGLSDAAPAEGEAQGSEP